MLATAAFGGAERAFVKAAGFFEIADLNSDVEGSKRDHGVHHTVIACESRNAAPSGHHTPDIIGRDESLPGALSRASNHRQDSSLFEASHATRRHHEALRHLRRIEARGLRLQQRHVARHLVAHLVQRVRASTALEHVDTRRGKRSRRRRRKSWLWAAVTDLTTGLSIQGTKVVAARGNRNRVQVPLMIREIALHDVRSPRWRDAISFPPSRRAFRKQLE